MTDKTELCGRSAAGRTRRLNREPLFLGVDLAAGPDQSVMIAIRAGSRLAPCANVACGEDVEAMAAALRAAGAKVVLL